MPDLVSGSDTGSHQVGPEGVLLGHFEVIVMC